jgi:hypothetical protein
VRSNPRTEPIWRLVEKAAEELTKQGRAPFTRGDVIAMVQRSNATYGPDSINPIIQGVTDNLRGGASGSVSREILHSVGRGQFVLRRTYTAAGTAAAKDTAVEALKTKAVVRAAKPQDRRRALRLGSYDFYRACLIEPEREGDGSVKEFMPQSGYRNSGGLPLNRYGAGPFCRFRIPRHVSAPGVYAILVGGEVRYLGECANLAVRYNVGYGSISPRNCFKNGQETNCRVNNLLLHAAKAKSEISLWFCQTENYKAAEKALLQTFSPLWNRR